VQPSSIKLQLSTYTTEREECGKDTVPRVAALVNSGYSS